MPLDKFVTNAPLYAKPSRTCKKLLAMVKVGGVFTKRTDSSSTCTDVLIPLPPSSDAMIFKDTKFVVVW